MAALTPLLARYSLEILLIVAAATAAASLVRVPPRARLIFWRAVLAGCLLLPLGPPRVLDVDGPTTAAHGAVFSPAATVIDNVSAPRPGLSPIDIVPWIVATGIVLRTLWLAVGFIRLRALRWRSETAVLDDDVRVLKERLAPGADVSWHDDLQQPVTFGVRRPVVLLPSRLRAAAPELRRAVVCHELVHVDRGDWAATIAEELILTVFWFHPAMWWTISQIQLYREATVDARVVEIVGSRRAYMQALLAFADARAPALAPVFARRRQVVVRIRQLSQEVVMSRMRLTVAAITLAVLVCGAGWSVVSAVPLRTEVRFRAIHPSPPPSPPAPSQPPSTPTGKTPPRPISKPNATYPAEALRYSPGAMVWVAVTIGPDGDVTEAKVSRWRLTIESSIDDPDYWANKPERAFIEAAEAAALNWKFSPPDANTRTTFEILFTFRNIRTGSGGPGGGPVVRVGGDIRPPVKLADVRPIYPEAARDAGVQGVVIMEVRIATDGSVADATIVQSVPMLDDAALEAVRQWRYQPTLLNGEHVEVMMTVTINFTVAPK